MSLSSLLTLSHWPSILGVAIIVISVFEVLTTGKTAKERIFKGLTAVLAIALLFIQAASNRQANADSQKAMKAALYTQKQLITADLTAAFKAGTEEVIDLAGQEADKTRKAADSQTKAIQSQDKEDEQRLEDVSLGSDACPKVLADSSMGNQRPFALSVFDADKNANIYDLVVYLQEGEHTADGKGFRTLQQKTLRYPTIPANTGSSLPFEFLSQRNTSYLQFSLSTRRKICSGLIVLHGDGNGYWFAQAYPVHEGPLAAHNTEVPVVDQPWNPGMIH
jgi:hypothetical protein